MALFSTWEREAKRLLPLSLGLHGPHTVHTHNFDCFAIAIWLECRHFLHLRVRVFSVSFNYPEFFAHHVFPTRLMILFALFLPIQYSIFRCNILRGYINIEMSRFCHLSTMYTYNCICSDLTIEYKCQDKQKWNFRKLRPMDYEWLRQLHTGDNKKIERKKKMKEWKLPENSFLVFISLWSVFSVGVHQLNAPEEKKLSLHFITQRNFSICIFIVMCN